MVVFFIRVFRLSFSGIILSQNFNFELIEKKGKFSLFPALVEGNSTTGYPPGYRNLAQNRSDRHAAWRARAREDTR